MEQTMKDYNDASHGPLVNLMADVVFDIKGLNGQLSALEKLAEKRDLTDSENKQVAAIEKTQNDDIAKYNDLVPK